MKENGTFFFPNKFSDVTINFGRKSSPNCCPEPFMIVRRLADLVAGLPIMCEEPDVSTASYLRILKFPDRQSSLLAGDVADALRRVPSLTDKWIARSGDQRIAGGWEIEADFGHYHIYRHGNSFGYIRYPDQVTAVQNSLFDM